MLCNSINACKLFLVEKQKKVHSGALGTSKDFPLTLSNSGSESEVKAENLKGNNIHTVNVNNYFNYS